MKFNLAFTAPINPPSVSPVLHHAQVWKGLLQKCRKPHEFVKAISDCEILEEDDNGLKRLVTFKPGMGPPEGKATEVITYRGQTTAEFRMIGAGNFITNTISNGKGGPDDLYLTFTFEWDFPDIQEGSKEAEEKEALLKQDMGVLHSIEVMRAMVRNGQL